MSNIPESVLLMHLPSISSCNSSILLYSDVFLFCILRNPNLQGIDFFFFSLADLGICYRFFCVWIWKFVGRVERWDENWWFIKGNLVIFGRAQRIKIKMRMSFLFMDLQSSINSNSRFFTNIKRNFFQKVAFYTYQTLFSGWLFWKRAFWASNAETNGHKFAKLLYELMWVIFGTEYTKFTP